MACLHHRHLHVFSRKLHPSTLNFTKLKTLIQTVVFSHVYRLAGALARAKSILLHFLKDFHIMHLLRHHHQLPIHNIIINKTTNNNNKKKPFLGSFRLHYNWCSSHVVPVPTPVNKVVTKCLNSEDDSISTWNNNNSIIFGGRDGDESSSAAVGLSGYLEWLEEKHVQYGGSDEGPARASTENSGDDIDRMADMFIADCHERFRLEKVESDRRFQEMLARSV